MSHPDQYIWDLLASSVEKFSKKRMMVEEEETSVEKKKPNEVMNLESKKVKKCEKEKVNKSELNTKNEVVGEEPCMGLFFVIFPSPDNCLSSLCYCINHLRS